MVINATFNYISVISSQFYWWRKLEDQRKPSTCRKPLTNLIIYCCTSVVIGTDGIGSCKSNYHMITATTAPLHQVYS